MWFCYHTFEIIYSFAVRNLEHSCFLWLILVFFYSFKVVTCPSINSFTLEHGRWRIVNGSHYEYKTKVVFSCDPGYFRLGPASIQCLANGTWSWRNERPHCQSMYRRIMNSDAQTRNIKRSHETNNHSCVESFKIHLCIKGIQEQQYNKQHFIRIIRDKCIMPTLCWLWAFQIFNVVSSHFTMPSLKQSSSFGILWLTFIDLGKPLERVLDHST